MFWTANPVAQYHAVMRAETAQRGYDIGETARAFALLGTSMGDTQISCWRAKFDEAYWRPITAVHEAGRRRERRDDGGPDVEGIPGDPAVPRLHERPRLRDRLRVGGVRPPVRRRHDRHRSCRRPCRTVPTGHFASTSSLDDETMDARIWLGFHFRKAMTDANALGHTVAGHVIANTFRRPTDRDTAADRDPAAGGRGNSIRRRDRRRASTSASVRCDRGDESRVVQDDDEHRGVRAARSTRRRPRAAPRTRAGARADARSTTTR